MFTHPSDGKIIPYNIDVYAKNGRLLLSVIRGNLGNKRATGTNRHYALELHNAVTWAEMIESGATSVPAYIQRWPSRDWLPIQRWHVKTPRIRENFIEVCYLEQDDDTGEPDTVEFWLNDDFFKNYGYAFIESTNSTKDAQKGHPFVVFDQDITDRDLYEEMLRAWIWHYQEHADKAINSCNEISYHKKGSKLHIVGNVCPLDIFEETFLEPYREYIETEKRKIAQRKRRRKKAVPHKKDYTNYVKVVHDNLIQELENTSEGTGERHETLLKVGLKLAMLAQADWHNVDTSGWEDDIMSACMSNGYVSKYGEESVTRTLLLWDSVDSWEIPD